MKKKLLALLLAVVLVVGLLPTSVFAAMGTVYPMGSNVDPHAVKMTDCVIVNNGTKIADCDHVFRGTGLNEVAPTCTMYGYELTQCKAYHGPFAECDAMAHYIWAPALDHEDKDEDGYCDNGCGKNLCKHSFVKKEGKPAACNVAGWSDFEVCEKCGLEQGKTEIAALEHAWSDWKVQDSTCVADGIKARVCKLCNTEEKEDIKSEGHDYVAVVTNATCEEAGYTTYTCSVCKSSYVDNKVDALGHDKTTVETNATCTEAGGSVTTCSRCEFKEETVVAATGHKVDDEGICSVCGEEVIKVEIEGPSWVNHEGKEHNWVLVSETKAACGKEGKAVYTCTVPLFIPGVTCGEYYTKTVVTPALEHELVETVEVEPTCEKAGKKVITCAFECGLKEVEELAALGHKTTSVKTEPTCTEAGKIVTTCANGCGMEDVEVIDALGHDLSTVKTEATCTEAGKTVTTCSRCDYKDETVIPATGHGEINDDGECVVCGEELIKVEITGPSWVNHEGKEHNWVLVSETKATCVTEGKAVYTCTVPLFVPGTTCGEFWSKTVTTPALGTEHGDTFTFTVEANCTDKGVVKTYCQVCEALLSSEELPTNDNHFFYNGVCQLCGAKDECKHDYVVVREQAADCTNPAYKWYKCSICGNEKNGEEGAADPKAHDYKVVKELAPTCIEAGYVWKKCSICGNEKNHEQGAATGVHTYEVVKELAPTCVEAGYVWKECSVCGWEKNHEQGEATGVHTWKKDVTEATCTEPGLIQPYCEICGAKSPLSAQTPALGHDVKDGACTRCDYVEPTKPTEPEETTKPSEPEETTKPTEPEETTKPTEPEATTKPTEPEATTKPTEKPTEAPTEAPTTKPAETTKPADPALDNVPKTGDNTGMILATMTTIALLSAMAFVFGKKRSVR